MLKIIMNDPIDRLRKAFETCQAMNSLNQAAEKSEMNRLEQDWRDFVSRAVNPAFEKARLEVFREKYEPLTERIDPGFKVKDLPECEFWFWIELRGRVPVAYARRKFGNSPSLSGVSTPHLNSKAVFDIADVTEDHVFGAIVFAYEKSFFGGSLT